MSGDTWHDHVDATWNPGGVTHGMIQVLHLCERLTLSQVSSGGKRRKRKIKKIADMTCGRWKKVVGCFPRFDQFV